MTTSFKIYKRQNLDEDFVLYEPIKIAPNPTKLKKKIEPDPISPKSDAEKAYEQYVDMMERKHAYATEHAKQILEEIKQTYGLEMFIIHEQKFRQYAMQKGEGRARTRVRIADFFRNIPFSIIEQMKEFGPVDNQDNSKVVYKLSGYRHKFQNRIAKPDSPWELQWVDHYNDLVQSGQLLSKIGAPIERPQYLGKRG